MLRALLAITHNTFTESMRQPIFLVLTLIGVLMLIITPQLSNYTMEGSHGDNKMLVELGLGNVWLVGMLLACFTATGILVREIEEKSVLTVVSKPVPRAIFLLGKFAGCGAAIAVACTTLGFTLLLLLRHRVMSNFSDTADWPVVFSGVGLGLAALAVAFAANYLHHKPFCSICGVGLALASGGAFLFILFVNKQWQFQSPATEFTTTLDDTRTSMREAGVGLLFVLQGILVMTAVAIALSTRLSQVATLIICLLVFLLGVGLAPLSQHLSAQLGMDRIAPLSEALPVIWHAKLAPGTKLFYLAVKGLSSLVPNLQLHWPADALGRGSSLVHDSEGHFSLAYLGRVSLYTLLQVTGILGLGAVAFQRREVS